ncbi:MAG: TRAP transporter small permease subunit [Maritimibacter sp.]|jgi:TRAP-type mannitol/chloroaromatic compound transport system permease small subunit
MTSISATTDIPRHGKPAPIARLFGWAMLGSLAGFLINNVLVVWFGYPGLRALGSDPAAWVHLAIYVIGIALALAKVLIQPNNALRWDARQVHHFNLYLVRALYFTVLFVGLADAAIAFLRAEELLGIFGQSGPQNFARANWVGPYIHVPLIVAGFIASAIFRRTLGFPWLALLIVSAELLIVLSRFVFSYEQALMGDLVRYWYAALFLFGSAYTLFDDGHVRVDIIYAGLGNRAKGRANAIGVLLLGMTTAWVVLAVGLNGPHSIVNAPVTNFEISQAGRYGMYIKYQMAAFIGLYATTMLIQFVSMFFEVMADARGEPGHRSISGSTAQ